MGSPGGNAATAVAACRRASAACARRACKPGHSPPVCTCKFHDELLVQAASKLHPVGGSIAGSAGSCKPGVSIALLLPLPPHRRPARRPRTHLQRPPLRFRPTSGAPSSWCTSRRSRTAWPTPRCGGRGPGAIARRQLTQRLDCSVRCSAVPLAGAAAPPALHHPHPRSAARCSTALPCPTRARTWACPWPPACSPARPSARRSPTALGPGSSGGRARLRGSQAAALPQARAGITRCDHAGGEPAGTRR